MKILILLVISSMFLTGCADYREVEKLTIATGIALDKNIDNPYKLDICVEVVKFKQNVAEVSYIKSSGETYSEAISNVIQITGNEIYFGHTAVMVISYDMACEGILSILDDIYRNSDLRLDMNIVVANGDTSAEILQTKSLIDDISGIQIKEIIQSNNINSEVPSMPVYEFIDDVTAKGTDGYLPIVKLNDDNEEEYREIDGVAIFKEDYLYDILDQKQAKTLVLLKNKMEKGTVINEYIVKTPTYRTQSAKTSITPIYEDGKLSFDFDIKIELIAIQDGTDLLDLDKKASAEEDISLAIKKDVDDLIKVQMNNSGSDFLALGDLVYRKYVHVYNQLHGDFSNEIKNLDYTLNVECKIVNSGLMSEPLKIH